MRLRLEMTPRWTYPDPRVDAVRGCVAIERGPLVYCFEQTDQPATLDEVAVIPGTGPSPVPANTVSPNTVLANTVSPNTVSPNTATANTATANTGPASTGLTEHAVTLPGIGATVKITAPGRHLPSGAAAWVTGQAPAVLVTPDTPADATSPASAFRPTASPAWPGPEARAVTVTAIPYFQWDNRGPGTMRVWIPTASPALSS